MSSGVAADVGAPERTRLWSRRRALTFFVAATVITALAMLGWEWRHAKVFDFPVGNTVSIRNNVGSTAFIGVVFSPSEGERHTITLKSATPQVSGAPEGATVELLVCHDGGVGAARGSLEPYCSTVEPAVAGAQFDVGERSNDQIVVKICSQQPGRVVVNGVELSYTSGWQHGSEITGLNAVATFR